MFHPADVELSDTTKTILADVEQIKPARVVFDSLSELRRAIPAVSEKMLIQQLRQLERDGVVHRFVHHQVPPKVEYSLTDWGQALCPALDALLKWVYLKKTLMGGDV